MYEVIRPGARPQPYDRHVGRYGARLAALALFGLAWLGSGTARGALSLAGPFRLGSSASMEATAVGLRGPELGPPLWAVKASGGGSPLIHVSTRGLSMPDLYFLGLTWQHTRGSALVDWVKDVAAYLAEQIRAFRTSARRRAS